MKYKKFETKKHCNNCEDEKKNKDERGEDKKEKEVIVGPSGVSSKDVENWT